MLDRQKGGEKSYKLEYKLKKTKVKFN